MPYVRTTVSALASFFSVRVLAVFLPPDCTQAGRFAGASAFTVLLPAQNERPPNPVPTTQKHAKNTQKYQPLFVVAASILVQVLYLQSLSDRAGQGEQNTKVQACLAAVGFFYSI